jgi:hypothetical protein
MGRKEALEKHEECFYKRFGLPQSAMFPKKCCQNFKPDLNIVELGIELSKKKVATILNRSV